MCHQPLPFSFSSWDGEYFFLLFLKSKEGIPRSSLKKGILVCLLFLLAVRLDSRLDYFTLSTSKQRRKFQREGIAEVKVGRGKGLVQIRLSLYGMVRLP